MQKTVLELFSKNILISLPLSTLLLMLFLFQTASIQQDDAYIFYTYAQNLAEGHGYVFNEGERINATTSFLYTVLLAGSHITIPGISLPKIAHVIGVICLGVIALLGTDILYRNKLYGAALFFAPLFLLHPFLIHGVGMETFLGMALSVGTLYEYVRGRYSRMAVFAALAVCARPDAILFPIIIFIDYVIRYRRFPSYRPIILFFSIVGAVYLFFYQYFGALLPSTLAAKVAQTESGRWGDGLLFLQGLVDIWPSGFLGILWLFLLCIPLLYIFISKREYIRMSSGVRIILFWALAYVVIYGFVLNPPAYAWYFTPLSLSAAIFAALFFEIVTNEKNIKYFAPVIPALIIVMTVPLVTFDGDDKYVSYVSAAEWLNVNAHEGATVASNEIGVLGYHYNKGSIIDGLGLVTPGGIEDIRNKRFHWYIDEYMPDYLVLLDPPRAVLESYVKEEWFKARYEKVHTILEPQGVGIYKRDEAN